MITKKFNLKVKDKILPFNKSINVDADICPLALIFELAEIELTNTESLCNPPITFRLVPNEPSVGFEPDITNEPVNLGLNCLL